MGRPSVCKKSQESVYLRPSHIFGCFPAMKMEKLSDPIYVNLFGADTVMTDPNEIADLLNEV